MLVKNATGYTPERPCAAVNCAVSAALLRTRELPSVKFACKAIEGQHHNEHSLKVDRIPSFALWNSSSPNIVMVR